ARLPGTESPRALPLSAGTWHLTYHLKPPAFTARIRPRQAENRCRHPEDGRGHRGGFGRAAGGVGMDIQDMRIFARVAALQNLSAVGVELGLTPGTISKRVQALEDELSARLFDRTTRSIRITEEGRAFLAHVERILAEVAAARASVDDRVGNPKGK